MGRYLDLNNGDLYKVKCGINDYIVFRKKTNLEYEEVSRVPDSAVILTEEQFNFWNDTTLSTKENSTELKEKTWRKWDFDYNPEKTYDHITDFYESETKQLLYSVNKKRKSEQVHIYNGRGWYLGHLSNEEISCAVKDGRLKKITYQEFLDRFKNGFDA